MVNFFYNLGFLLRRYKNYWCEKQRYYYRAIIIGLQSFLLLFSMKTYYNIVDILNFGIIGIAKFLFVVMMQISSLSFYFGIVMIIRVNLLLQYIGKRSLFVFGLHLLIIWPLIDKIIPKLSSIFNENLILKSTIYVLSSLVVTLILEKIYSSLKGKYYQYVKSKENNIEVKNVNI